METHVIGKRLAVLLQPGDVIALIGNLGSGKTVFAQGICAGLDVTDYVTSPSFTLLQIYRGRHLVYHYDFYRIKSPSEVEDLDVVENLSGSAISLIEWPEIGQMFLPSDSFKVHIDRIEEDRKIVENKRRIKISAFRNRGLSEIKL
jgi:tRNA threonylcarbamoyladenosine biosynthesis protein TsaE